MMPADNLNTKTNLPNTTAQKASSEDVRATPEESRKKSEFWSTVWETARYAVIAAIIIIPIRTFIAQPFVVSGISMYPTFHNGEYLIVDELSKYIGVYNRGDVVILRYPNDPSRFFIKRIIGLPGETVTIKDGTVTISQNNAGKILTLDEPYVQNPKDDTLSRTLDQEEYFVMGDNRAQSSDSRIWGPVPKKLMGGKVFARLYPFTGITLHPGSLDKFNVQINAN